MKVQAQLKAIQKLQETVQRTLEGIQAQISAAEQAHPPAQQDNKRSECKGGVYPLDHASSFVANDEVVTMNNGHSLRIDDILYGYDWLFEQKRLFSAGSWLGIQSQQDPADLVVIQQILWDVKPRVVYDIGTNVGGSAILFSHVMSQYARPGEAVVVSVDPKNFTVNWDREAQRLCPRCTPVADNPLWGQYVRYVQARAVDQPAVATLEAAIAKHGGPVLISVDGWHEYPEVIQECKTFAKYVTVGSYMIVQDTKLDRIFGRRGPRRAVRDFLRSNTDFVIDKSREVFLYSQHTDGFLLRVK